MGLQHLNREDLEELLEYVIKTEVEFHEEEVSQLHDDYIHIEDMTEEQILSVDTVYGLAYKLRKQLALEDDYNERI